VATGLWEDDAAAVVALLNGLDGDATWEETAAADETAAEDTAAAEETTAAEDTAAAEDITAAEETPAEVWVCKVLAGGGGGGAMESSWNIGAGGASMGNEPAGQLHRH
jgi:hypothetical protein